MMASLGLCLLASLVEIGFASSATPTNVLSVHTLQDTAGRTVPVPKNVQRVVVIGPVPVLNSFILALGKGETIVNGLPLFAQTPRHKYQLVFAPTLARQPVVQGPGREPDIEVLLRLRPDLVLTMDKGMAETLERKGFSVLVLTWRNPEDLKTTMVLLGKVFQRENEAQAYVGYVDRMMLQIAGALEDVPESQRPKVLFCSLKTLTQPHLIADWWIRKAGGISVTENGRTIESVSFSMEHILKWNPDILVVSTPGEITEAYQDTRLSTVRAVMNRKVYSIPAGAHPWGYRTVEQPLTILWAATLFHPDRTSRFDLKAEMKKFYGRFFRYALSDEQVQEMLSGIP